jgi:hypothetical protein
MKAWPSQYLVVPRTGTLMVGWREIVIKIPRGYQTVTLYASRDYKWKLVPIGCSMPRLIVQYFGDAGETTYDLLIRQTDENDIVVQTTPAEYLGLAICGLLWVEVMYVFK